MNKLSLIIFFSFLTSSFIYGQNNSVFINPDLHEKEWNASWITHPSASSKDYGVFHFRNEFILEEKPDSFIIHVSADNRYRLFVNGKPVGFGPARGDIGNWRFESYNISDLLTAGKNVIASMVWNMGDQKPLAQQTVQTRFILQGNSSIEKIINTGTSEWKVVQNFAYSPIYINSQMVQGYYAAGACDNVQGAKYPWGWEGVDFRDDSWLNVKVLNKGEPSRHKYGYGNSFGLVPRNIPMMEEKQERFKKIARSSVTAIGSGFIDGTGSLKIPQKTKSQILLDFGHLTVGYPEMIISGGKSAKIKITYSEALFDKDLKKGHRDSISDKKLYGYYDVFIADGKADRMYRPLWMRTFRFVQLEIETGNSPLTIHDFYHTFTAYPFERKATFVSGDSTLAKIWDVSWRTARLCAVETYFDCPYYEQLQYIGDTRIQALISYYMSGDDRLAKNAIEQFDHSRIAAGLTLSRYPSGQGQVIPPFSLVWIGMLHDHFMYKNDPKFVSQFLPGIDAVLQWFEQKIDKEKGMLGALDWWNFTDWAEEFNRGVPPGAETGNSVVISLQFANALDYATELFYEFGKKEQARRYSDLSYSIKQAVYKSCFDLKKGLLADTPEKTSFSQHANILGILTDAIPVKDQTTVMHQLFSDNSLVQTTIYYRFYFNRALLKTGLGHLYLECMDPWNQMLNDGLTTFAETDVNPRSDCHAWSASPSFDFISIVTGIQPAAPGFKKVRISPNLGTLNEVSGKIPHESGDIEVHFRKNGATELSAVITLPEGLDGDFIWNEKSIAIKSGKQSFKL